MKIYEGDKCPKCNEGILEYQECKDEEYLICDSCQEVSK